MGNRTREKRGFWALIISFIINLSVFILWTMLWGLLQSAKLSTILGNLLLDVIGAFIITFSFWASYTRRDLLGWNEWHPVRYSLVTGICAMAFGTMPYIPFLTAPIGAVSVILTLFSGGFCGMAAYLFLVIQYVLLNGPAMEQVIVLILTGLMGVVLFRSIDRELRYGGLLFVYLVSDFVCYSVYYVMTSKGAALGDALLYTGIRLFSELIIILLCLKILGKYFIYRDEDFFAIINNPEYSLLSQLKGVSKEAYFHAIHTAYLSEKISRKIRINVPLTKAGGYYHKIGILQGEDSIQNTIHVGSVSHFPKTLIRLLKEYGAKNPSRISKEAAVVQLSDAVVSSISYMFLKDKNAVLNYEKIIDVIIRKKMDSRDWNGCELTMEELCKIKEGFAEEKLYYDFLR